MKRKTAEVFEMGHKESGYTSKILNQENEISKNKDNFTMDNLENLVELINLKNNVDYCLEKLEPIVNA